MDFKEIKIAIIIPTYKESESISILADRILTIFPNAKIIIVDDSPVKENTKIKEQFKKKKDTINICSRFKKEGRGSAVIVGFKQALKNKATDFFFEMDADLAHNPDEIVNFLKKRNQADVIVGSRYLSESKITQWPLRRLILSKTINAFLKIWLGINLTDYTNGFRMYNRKSIEYVCSVSLKEKGFILLSEVIYRLKKAGFKIIEIPITFKDRTYGKSNAGIREHVNSLIGLVRIRFS
ncbi:MAG: hypothetical protein A3G13_02875 [Candidatus Levybacteria bacterium RIFCSPLOWO2_12_FULL_37_7]|nr:MAG: hypothetical protein A3J14_01835 [Candidatus Levybacteria bacterium RIFCSPLOWO2_02_FULL_37_18]OGH50403.1 MAG: hypothetical protein A3G13_02875 [Candidatus Levybacteria bacterium RIFCSPLOWO2_12_FULL_37_7]